MTFELWLLLGFIVVLGGYICVRQWFVHNIPGENRDSDLEK